MPEISTVVPAPFSQSLDSWAKPEFLPENLPEDDGEPMDSAWHRNAMNFLIELIRCHLKGRTDFYVGGNMFIHFSPQQVRNNDFRGPDVFLVKNVDGSRKRRFWAVWLEGGRYPDLIVELLSPTTAANDRTTKKTIYEQTFCTPEYFCYDPETQKLEGWKLRDHRYEALIPNDRGWLWSDELHAWLGSWEGLYQRAVPDVYLRLFDAEGRLILSLDEDSQQQFAAAMQQVEAQSQHAETERRRAEAAEAELARLKTLLAEKGGPAPG